MTCISYVTLDFVAANFVATYLLVNFSMLVRVLSVKHFAASHSFPYPYLVDLMHVLAESGFPLSYFNEAYPVLQNVYEIIWRYGTMILTYASLKLAIFRIYLSVHTPKYCQMIQRHFCYNQISTFVRSSNNISNSQCCLI